MKVKDLIQALLKQNQEANIYISCEGYSNAFDDDCETRLLKINKDNLILSDSSEITIEKYCYNEIEVK